MHETCPESLFGFVLVVCATAQPDAVVSGTPASRYRLDVIEFQHIA